MKNEHNEICAGKIASQKLLQFVVRIVAAFMAARHTSPHIPPSCPEHKNDKSISIHDNNGREEEPATATPTKNAEWNEQAGRAGQCARMCGSVRSVVYCRRKAVIWKTMCLFVYVLAHFIRSNFYQVLRFVHICAHFQPSRPFPSLGRPLNSSLALSLLPVSCRTLAPISCTDSLFGVNHI